MPFLTFLRNLFDERFPGYLEAHTVLVDLDPPSAGLVSEGRVGGELGDARHGLGHDDLAAVVAQERSVDVVVELVELGGPEVGQRLYGGELVPGGGLLGVLGLELGLGKNFN